MSAQGENNRVTIFDTTLRDGEQSPGAAMNREEKVRVAQALEAMGVDVIEAGFPAASEGDFEAVGTIAREVRESSVCGLARARRKDIDRAHEAIRAAPRHRIHTFISTSPLHMTHKLGMDPEAVVEAVHDSVTHARGLVDDVEWSAEDATRTDPDFLCRCVETAVKAGAGTVNIPDTVGYSFPEEYGSLIRMLLERVPGADAINLSVHCHDDLGLAVANSLAAVQNGARQIECTINGLGERAGNAALEEVVMSLRTRRDRLPFGHGVRTEHIMKTSRLVSAFTGFQVQPNKAIVGRNAFAHEAGIHQHGVMANAQTYEIMTPESVGLTESNLVLGKHSGRHAFRAKLEELGYALDEASVDDAFARFKALADRKKEVFDEDVVALVDDAVHAHGERVRLNDLDIHCGTRTRPQTAALSVMVDGAERTATREGDGPVDAICNAIRAVVPNEARLQLYQVHAVTGGTDAQAEVTVRLEAGERTYNGQGADTDTLVASARAYLAALNKLLNQKTKEGEDLLSA